MDEQLKKKVRELLARLDLPKDVYEEFDLSTITENEGLERQVAKKVRERLDTYAGMLEYIIQPDQTLTALNEYGYFNEEEHQSITRLYRKLMRAIRSHTAHDIGGKAEDYAAFLKEALAVWRGAQPELARIATKLRDGWDREEPLHVEKGYLG